MQETINYNLKKPEANDNVNIDDLNFNFDIIDEKLFAVIQAWENFKANGGEICGSVITGNDSNESYLPFIAKRLNLDKKLMEIHFGVTDTGAGTLMRMVNGVNGGRYDFDWQGFYPVDEGDVKRGLGLADKPWGDIHLKGVSKNPSGYTKLPNGMIMQWGDWETTATTTTDSYTYGINFPVTFTSQCLFVIPIAMTQVTSGNWAPKTCDYMLHSWGLSSLTLKLNQIASQRYAVRWFAIGY
ncbi:MAG: hypothetical protein E6585_23980 [Serratia marcescens]|nr:hypothetical protein [Serratia marcescens]